VPYLFLYRNWLLKLDFQLSFADSASQENELSAILGNFAGEQIHIRTLLAARGFTAEAALFEYPQAGARVRRAFGPVCCGTGGWLSMGS